MKSIPLTQGKFALVDDEDFEWLSQWKWSYTGYATRGAAGTTLSMHREIIQAPHGKQVDHINGDKLDNRRSNLRLCTPTQNQHNQKPRRTGTSIYKGVSWHSAFKKWRATIKVNRVMKFIGYFTDETEAAHAYDRAAHKYFGEFARPNFSQEGQQ